MTEAYNVTSPKSRLIPNPRPGDTPRPRPKDKKINFKNLQILKKSRHIKNKENPKKTKK